VLKVVDANGYDPRAFGARCDLCVLRTLRQGDPVPPEVHKTSRVVVIAEAPGETEVEYGRPLVGQSGQEEERVLAHVGLHREDVFWTNACLCRPPGNNYDAVLSRVREDNKKVKQANEAIREANKRRRAEGLPLERLLPSVPTPVDCCRPRLLRELEGRTQVIALGKISLQALEPKHKSGILKVRGAPVSFDWQTCSSCRGEGWRRYEVDGQSFTEDCPDCLGAGKGLQRVPDGEEASAETPADRLLVLPTVHPAFILRARRWLSAFVGDHLRAVRLFRGGLTWRNPRMVYNPTLDYVYKFLGLEPRPEPPAGSKPDGAGNIPGWSGGWWANPQLQRPLAFDWETDALEPLDCVTRCVQIGTASEVFVVAFRSVEKRKSSPYGADELEHLIHMLRAWFSGNGIKIGHNCLYLGTPVRLADGRSVPIEKLVRMKFDGDVLGQDAQGRVVPSKVLGWTRQRVEAQEWVTIRREHEKGHARGLTVTPDHRVYTQRGRIPAQDVVPGDFLLGPEVQLEPDQEQALLGTLLGDSSCAAHTSRSGAAGGIVCLTPGIFEFPKAILTGSHTNRALVDEKIQWLRGHLLAVKPQKPTPLNAAGMRPYPYRTPQMRQVALLARRVYDQTGKRRFQPALLETLSPVAWAWLFADDGGRHRRSGARAGGKEQVLIATCGFPAEDREAARVWMTTRFGYTSLTRAGSLSLGVEATERFIGLIAPFLLPAVRYKLPDGYGAWPEFAGFPERTPRFYPTCVESVESFVPPQETAGQRTSALTKWCLTTETGNFLTGFGLVKNSNYYDGLVNAAFLGTSTVNSVDNMMGHRLIEGELPHSLAYLGSTRTDVHLWKAGDPGVNARTDMELWSYGLLDSAVTAAVAPEIYQTVAERGLGNFASTSWDSTRQLREPLVVTVEQKPAKEEGGPPKLAFTKALPDPLPRGANWWWVLLDPEIEFGRPIPTLVIQDPAAPRDQHVVEDLVTFQLGLATPRTEVQARAMDEAGAFPVRPGLQGLLAADHAMQDTCRGLHVNGMLVDQKQRLAYLWDQSNRFHEQRAKILELVAALSPRDRWGSGWLSCACTGSVASKKPGQYHPHAPKCRKCGKQKLAPAFNPASTYHLRYLLYDDLKLPKTVFSEKTGAPSTGDSALRKFLLDDSLLEAVREYILALRAFRKAHKIIGTYLKPMALRHPDHTGLARPNTGWGKSWNEAWASDELVIVDDRQISAQGDVDWDDPEQAEELEALEVDSVEGTEEAFAAVNLYAPGKEIKDSGGKLRSLSKLRVNDRVHPDWKAHVAVTGRVASSPNLQNVLRKIRSMFVPASLEYLLAERERILRTPNEMRAWASYGVDVESWFPREGHVFVYADSDQIELRIAASRWKARQYLKAFAEGLDPHQITMFAIWQDDMWRLPGAPSRVEDRYTKAFEKNSEFDRCRDLGKRVLYSSVSNDTAIITLDSPGEHRIDSLPPGAITWVWSRTRLCLEPARVVRAWRSGTGKKLVAVTFKDARGNLFVERVTPNHLFMLRTGEFRAAEALQSGDRLMPFKRYQGGSGYRMLDKDNSGNWVLEHRQYAQHVAGDSLAGWHVHHKDWDKANNHPDNLECLSISEHAKEHHAEKLGEFNARQWTAEEYAATCSRLAAARKASSVWWDWVNSPEGKEARAEGVRAHWADPERSAVHREAISGVQESCLDVLAHEIGTVPDQVIADKVGCTKANVVHWRSVRGVPSWEETYRAEHGLKRDAVKVHPLLGQVPDDFLAKDLGCDRALVTRVRKDMGLPDPPKAVRADAGQVKPSKLDDYAGFFGVIPAGEIARLAGATAGTASVYAQRRNLLSRVDPARAEAFTQEVGRTPDARLSFFLGVTEAVLAQYRDAHGIPRYWDLDAPDEEELNHEVVGVVELPGLHDVWDLEVDHEDHDFALASGIIVHNSQYGAKPPTVHDVITSAEDKKGKLLYPKLSKARVTVMQRNLLKNCPEFKRGWEWELATLKAQGYLEEPVTGRRFECLDGYEDLSLVVNRPIQSSASAIINLATIEMMQKYPPGFAGPYTGLVNHCHDAMTWECPISMAPALAIDLTRAMTRIIPAYPDVVFVGEAEICQTWQ